MTSIRAGRTDSALHRPSGGFRQLYRRESIKWWHTRRWWIQALIWLVGLNGLVGLVLFVLPGVTLPDGQPILAGVPDEVAVEVFFGMGSSMLAIGIIVLAQDEIIGELQAGTAEWLLSKPVSRSAFVLSKVAALTVGMVAIMIVIQGAVAYAQLAAYGAAPSARDFLAGLGLMTLHSLFYLTLTLLMGIVSTSRGVVLGVPLTALLGAKLILGFVEPLARLAPFLLPDLIPMAVSGQMPEGAGLITMVIATGAWSVVFVVAALWRFQQHEF